MTGAPVSVTGAPAPIVGVAVGGITRMAVGVAISGGSVGPTVGGMTISVAVGRPSGGNGVAVGIISVAVGPTGVAVGLIGVLVGGIGVPVGGMSVGVAARGVSVGTGVKVGKGLGLPTGELLWKAGADKSGALAKASVSTGVSSSQNDQSQRGPTETDWL